ncbi:MAG: hypothetical protein LBL98_00515 [Ruminococcus sp.]|jgi:flagellar basal body-associated protein FliL|nr:hypothetical protein [Ruminococcus sp.]
MKRKKSAGIIVRVLIIIVLTVLIGGVLVFNFFFKTDGTPSSVFGIYFLRTNEVYMETEIMPGDMVIAVKTDPEKIEPQDAVIAQFDSRITIIRVIAVNPGTAGTPPTFLVKYDTVDESKAFNIDAERIVAVAKYKDPVMGQLLGVATSVPGIIIAVIIPLTLIIIYQIARFAREKADEEESDKPEKEKAEELAEIMSERPLEHGSMRLSGFTAELERMNNPEPPKTERKLSIDERGRAGIAEVPKTRGNDATRQIAIGAYRGKTPSNTQPEPGPKFASRIGYPEKENDAPVLFLPPEGSDPEVKKTNISDLIRDNERTDSSALRPKPASVIPEEVTRLQQTAPQSPRQAGFEDTVREYYKHDERAEDSGFAEPIGNIPEGAVVPKEKIAPVRRKKQRSTVDELMKLIDDQTSKRR